MKCLRGRLHSPEGIVGYYKVEPWSEAYFKLAEKSFELMGQLGNDILNVPVLTRNWRNWQVPLILFVKTEGGLQPDFTPLEKYLDVYLKYCAPPRALILYIWDHSATKELAQSTEGRGGSASRTWTPAFPPTIGVWDPATRKLSEATAPFIGDEGSEAFYKPVLDGVREIVKNRGWSERTIMVGLGCDARPGLKTGELLRQWAPYARWCIYSHFAGDVEARNTFTSAELKKTYKIGREMRPGQFIALGDLEVGAKQHCGVSFALPFATAQLLERNLKNPVEYLETFAARSACSQLSPPLTWRTFSLCHGDINGVGLDFWNTGGTRANPGAYSGLYQVAVPGPDGAIPTVQFQMLREGVQEWEARMAVVTALGGMPKERRESY